MVLRIEKAFEKLLNDLAFQMKQTIYSRVPPRNAPSTVAKKGFDFPLIEETDMVAAITYVKDSDTKGRVGIFDSENAAKAYYNQALGIEFEMSQVPGRPFMRITIDNKLDDLLKDFEESFVNEVINELR